MPRHRDRVPVAFGSSQHRYRLAQHVTVIVLITGRVVGVIELEQAIPVLRRPNCDLRRLQSLIKSRRFPTPIANMRSRIVRK